MCIIAYQPYGQTVSKRKLKNCFHTNSDGMGLMYCMEGEIIIEKEMRSFRRFYKIYRNIIEQDIQTNIVLHFRIATGGNKDINNCHPFMVHDKLAFCHNGILNYGNGFQMDKSDTIIFNEVVLQKLPKDFLNNEGISELICTSIDTNKLVFMDNEGHCTIFGEHQGEWSDGIWYSNDSYEGWSKYVTNTKNINIANRDLPNYDEGKWHGYDKNVSRKAPDPHFENECRASVCWNCGDAIHEEDKNSFDVCLSCLNKYGFYGITKKREDEMSNNTQESLKLIETV